MALHPSQQFLKFGVTIEHDSASSQTMARLDIKKTPAGLPGLNAARGKKLIENKAAGVSIAYLLERARGSPTT